MGIRAGRFEPFGSQSHPALSRSDSFTERGDTLRNDGGFFRVCQVNSYYMKQIIR